MSQTDFVAYGPHELNGIKLYGNVVDGQEVDTLIVYIHGGAWRSPNNTFEDADNLMNSLVGDGIGGASINYRLSPEIQHPEHLNDVISALNFLANEISFNSIVMVGHSAGAFLTLQAFMNDQLPNCSAMVLAEGIYDLVSLIEEYPNYRDFVAAAFTDDETTWTAASPANGNRMIATSEEEYQQHMNSSEEKAKNAPEWYLFTGSIVFVQSNEDELLSWNQTTLAGDRLFDKDNEHPNVNQALAYGRHDEVFASQRLADIVSATIGQ